jgi:hypothetical protein
MIDYLKIALAILIAMAVGGGLGYFYAPDKIKIEEKIVEKIVVKKEEYKKDQKKYDPTTGKIIEETTETGTKETNTNSTKTDKTEERVKSTKYYALKAGAVFQITHADKPSYRVGGEIRLPIFNSWLGAEGDLKLKDPAVGVYLRMEF